jgi:hypothetical protein
MSETKIVEGEAPAKQLVLAKPWDKAAIKLDQDGIKTDLGKLDFRIQMNHMQCLMHAMLHGDTSLERRLLLDIIDEKTGYRRKGLIAHMRLFTPMELKGDIINLSGLVTAEWQAQLTKLSPGIVLPAIGEKRPFLLELALNHPFTSLDVAREQVAWKPFYKDTVVSRIEAANKNYRAAIANTVIVAGEKPKPLDPSKPFYDGIHLDKMDAAFDKIEAILGEIESWKDSTKVVRDAHAKAAEAEAELAAAQQ